MAFLRMIIGVKWYWSLAQIISMKHLKSLESHMKPSEYDCGGVKMYALILLPH